MDNLNREQLEAINSLDGKISVVAGPGAGKTRVLVERVIKLIENKVPQSSILLITFTNKVREEIKERMKQLIGENSVNIHTFHSFAFEIIKENAKELNTSANLKILDSDDMTSLVEECKWAVIAENNDFRNESFDIVDFVKNNRYKNKLNLKTIFLKKIFEKFNELKLQNNYATYDDLIENLFFLLGKKRVLNKLTKKIKYLMVDECQDLNEEQYLIIESLEKNGLNNIFMVGDLDQSIYAWRGAKPSLFLNFYNNSKQIQLKNNYRSHDDIILTAKKLISCNKDRIDIDFIGSSSHSEGSVGVHEAINNIDQAEKISKEISSLIKNKVEPNQIAILFRMNYQANTIIDSLVYNKIFYKIYNDKDFYSKKEIKDTLSLLKLLNDENDLISWKRLVNNIINLNDNDKILSYKDDLGSYKENLLKLINNTLGEKHDKIISAIEIIEQMKKDDKLNYLEKTIKLLKFFNFKKIVCKNQEMIDNINLLLSEIESNIIRKINLETFLTNVGLDNVDYDESRCIKLMSIHSAKGLEFEHVFILNVNDGVIPHHIAVENNDVTEERRLMYVGITRAKKHLYIYYTSDKGKSMFLNEI